MCDKEAGEERDCGGGGSTGGNIGKNSGSNGNGSARYGSGGRRGMTMGSEGGIREMGSCELRVGIMVRFWDEDEEEEGKAGGRKRQVNHLFPWRPWGAPA